MTKTIGETGGFGILSTIFDWIITTHNRVHCVAPQSKETARRSFVACLRRCLRSCE
jgi:hypothetical protein